MSHDADLEQGEARPPTPVIGKKSNEQDKLKVFRDLVGINSLPDGSKRPAKNKGTYKRLVDAERNCRVGYYASASLINSCLLLQIVVAAALTALGAANASHLAITILGSVNTVIAGVMTYLKGQGLPNRLLQYANESRGVRERIEETERQFCRPDCKLDLDHEVEVIFTMYKALRKNAEENDPNSYRPFVPPSFTDADPKRGLPSSSSQPNPTSGPAGVMRDGASVNGSEHGPGQGEASGSAQTRLI